MIKVGIIGANGNIGKQALEIISQSNDLNLDFIVLNKNMNNIKNLVKKFKNVKIGIINALLKEKLHKINTNFVILNDDEIKEYIKTNPCDIILNATSGFAGLDWSVSILNSKTTLALANKESIVVAGEYIMNLAKKLNTKIIAVDSEHFAIQQCLKGENHNQIKRLILTCSGGPFFNFSKKEMKNITLEKALKHPTWSMGKKISIDSATLFNKCLEIIEARWLFNTTNIDVVVHKQSIIHSLVEFNNNSFKAQLSLPSMKIPISYALHNKNHIKFQNLDFEMDLTKIKKLTFDKIDIKKYRVIDLAYKAIKIGGTYPVVLNAANEYMVSLFLEKKCHFLDIFKGVKYALDNQKIIKNATLSKIKKIHYETIDFLKTKYEVE